LADLVPFLWGAGVLQTLIASANVFAVRMFHYRESMKTVPAHVAEVFWAQNVFIMLTVVGMAALCFGFAAELSSGDRLARCLSGFLSLFWGVRFAFQLFFYDRETRRRYRIFDVLFLASFVYLTVVFGVAAYFRA
jgi:hypothetical protein